jgi:dTDP-glucose 4,6-dehydratase
MHALPKKRTVVTGGAGFIGSHLCERFLAKGHQVVCVDNLLTGSRENVAHLMSNPDFQFVLHDVTRYIEIPGRVDTVLHFASPR